MWRVRVRHRLGGGNVVHNTFNIPNSRCLQLWICFISHFTCVLLFGIMIALSCVIFVFHVCHVAQPTDRNSVTQTLHWNTHCSIKKCCNYLMAAKELILFLEEVSMAQHPYTLSTGNSSKSKHQCFSAWINCNLELLKNKSRGHDVVPVLGLKGIYRTKEWALACIFCAAAHF